jgi:hypothetical protein
MKFVLHKALKRLRLVNYFMHILNTYNLLIPHKLFEEYDIVEPLGDCRHDLDEDFGVHEFALRVQSEAVSVFSAQRVAFYELLHFAAVEVPHFGDNELVDRDELSVLKFHYFAEEAVEVLYFAVVLALH